MHFSIIDSAPCINVPPPSDPRCSDPAFALANPGICPASPTLVVSPGTASACTLGSLQFTALYTDSNGTRDVTTLCTWTTSDPAIAVVGAASGNATGMQVGDAAITATYQGISASAKLSVLGVDCCVSKHVALMVLLDTSLSMSQAFGSSYATRLDFAKTAAKRFISEIIPTKDTIGVITFNDAQVTTLSPEGNNLSAEVSLVQGVTQTQQKTSFSDAVAAAIAQLKATSADELVILLISDGEDTTGDTTNLDSAISALADFKLQGGIVMCLGVRASRGFAFLEEFATGGFFINALPGSEADALNMISGLKGYVCAGNCAPTGDTFVHTGQLDYHGFANWNVTGGHVDLIGDGFMDLLPGNGLYVDLAGSSAPFKGQLSLKTPIVISANHTYRLAVDLAGNQRIDQNPESVRLRVVGQSATLLDQVVTIADFRQGFQTYAFSFTAPANDTVTLVIEQNETPQNEDAIGLLLGSVSFSDKTTLIQIFSEDFDGENLQYVPPRCGTGTTWVHTGSTYGYVTGTNCYGGQCLENPPGIQQPDPNPLPDIESASTPPTIYTGTKQACASCPQGSGNLSTGDLIPVMTGPTSPSGTASASTELPGDPSTPGKAFQAFNEYLDGQSSGVIGWGATAIPAWLRYDFPSPQVVTGYTLWTGTTQGQPKDWTFEGSNDGSTWTVLDTESGIGGWNLSSQSTDSRKVFPVSNSTAYTSYRINISATGDGNPPGIYEFRMLGTANTQVCQSATATSTVSQADADSKAYAAALAAATALLNCQTLYTSTESYTASCPANQYGQSVTRSATAVSYISQQDADAKALAAATAAAQAALDCTLSNNTQPITINDATGTDVNPVFGKATPYASVKNVTGAPSSISKVTVTLKGLSHTYPSDVLCCLQHPDGTTCLIMAHCGGDHVANNVTLTFDDAAASNLSSAALASGTYKPTQLPPPFYDPSLDVFPAPGPTTTPYGTTLSVFNGKDGNGSWALWVVDTAPVNTGQIALGFDLAIT